MKTICLATLLPMAVIIAAGCSGPTVPLSAQAGSSVVIPLTGELFVEVDSTIGFGGELVEDHQRGELVFKLRETGTELHTRATAAIRFGRAHTDVGRVQIVSLVDLPTSSPVGTFSIDVVRRFRDATGTLQETPIPYGGTLSVLPHELDVDCDQTVDLIGAPTPWGLLNLDGTLLSDPGTTEFFLGSQPEFVVVLSKSIHAFEADLDFPPDVISIEGVAASPGSSTKQKISWWDETAPGRASVGMLGRSSFKQVAIAFSLLDGENQTLDPAAVSVTIRSATDANGNEVAGTAVSGTFIR